MLQEAQKELHIYYTMVRGRMHQANHARIRPQGFEVARSAIPSPRGLWYNWQRPQVYHSYCFIQLDRRALLDRAVAPAGGAAALHACAGSARAAVRIRTRLSGSGGSGRAPARAPGHPGPHHHRACPFTCPLTTTGPCACPWSHCPHRSWLRRKSDALR